MESKNNDIQKILARRLKEARKAKNFSQPELAKLINSTDRNVSNYETGYSFPSIKVLYNISIALSTSVDYLFGFTNDPNIQTEGKQLSEADYRLLSDLKSDEEIYDYLTKNANNGVHYIYEIWKLMDEWKKGEP